MIVAWRKGSRGSKRSSTEELDHEEGRKELSKTVSWQGLDRKVSRGSKRSSTEELELDRIDIVGDGEVFHEELARTSSRQSMDSHGSLGEVISNCPSLALMVLFQMGRPCVGRMVSKKKSVCSTLSNTSEQVLTKWSY